MRVLALETSSDPSGIALADETGIVASHTFRHGRELSRWWAVRLQGLLEGAGWQVSDLDGLAVCHGPGSFTGLRIGVAALKTLAQAIGKPIVGVSTLDLLALPYRDAWPGTVLSLLYCRAGEVYRAAYGEAGTVLKEPAVRTLEELREEFEALPGPLLVCGDAGARNTLELPEGARRGDPWLAHPNVERLALEGVRRLSNGVGQDPMALTVLYLKRTQVEEQLEARKKAQDAAGSGP